tara:strand:+ start:334 stop:450 length:117 start_codon:yes stop_codon:yes gene_type:complete
MMSTLMGARRIDLAGDGKAPERLSFSRKSKARENRQAK